MGNTKTLAAANANAAFGMSFVSSKSAYGKSALFRLCPIFLLILLHFLPFACPNEQQQIQQQQPIRRNEMLVPLNSTTALICEPVFNQGRPSEGDGDDEARWMRDGREVARVNGHRNALIGADRGGINAESKGIGVAHPDPIPEIGFLLIRHTQREDEGEYWCERVGGDDDRQQGERTRLRVAYLEQFPKGTRPRVSFSPSTNGQPERGQLVVLDCPRPIGVPAPIISWQFNGEELRDFPALNMQMATNGSLLLHNFSSHQSGFYACEAVNFVAKTRSEPVFLGTPLAANQRRGANMEPASAAFVECLSAYVRNGVLWFLIGCLTTSCVVLAYILGALFLYRLYSIRDRHPHRWPRSLFAAPGFRKVVAPMAERMANQAAPPPPPYESPESSTTTTMTRSGGGGEQFDV